MQGKDLVRKHQRQVSREQGVGSVEGSSKAKSKYPGHATSPGADEHTANEQTWNGTMGVANGEWHSQDQE